MSQKFNLVQDTERDTPMASIKRHLGIIALLITLVVIAIAVLTTISALSGITAQKVAEDRINARQQQIADAKATQAVIRANRPTATPTLAPTPRPTRVSYGAT